MAKYVSDVIHHELFMLSPEVAVGVARDALLALGITGAPVLDEQGRPIGAISLRDMFVERDADSVAEHMTRPADTIAASATLKTAASVLDERGRHRLVVIDDDGVAVGMLSAIDVIRGLRGLPSRFSVGFPHLDPETGLIWSDDNDLDLDHVAGAPAAPGLLVLVHARPGSPDRPVWIEASQHVRSRLFEILSNASDLDPVLRGWVADEGRFLRFRSAEVGDAKRRDQALARLSGRAQGPAWSRDSRVKTARAAGRPR